MLKHSILTVTALIGLGLALPFATVSDAQAARACVAAPCGGLPPPPPPPPGGGNPVIPDNPGGPGGSAVFDEGPDFAKDSSKLKLLIACRVPRDMGPETTELRFRNIGDATIPGGTRVNWNANGQGGMFFLPGDLPVGKDLAKADLLKLGVPAEAGCMSALDSKQPA
jgi:hypothetical protein